MSKSLNADEILENLASILNAAHIHKRKPRLRKVFCLIFDREYSPKYICEGQGQRSYGELPAQAYQNWELLTRR